MGSRRKRAFGTSPLLGMAPKHDSAGQGSRSAESRLHDCVQAAFGSTLSARISTKICQAWTGVTEVKLHINIENLPGDASAATKSKTNAGFVGLCKVPNTSTHADKLLVHIDNRLLCTYTHHMEPQTLNIANHASKLPGP